MAFLNSDLKLSLYTHHQSEKDLHLLPESRRVGERGEKHIYSRSHCKMPLITNQTTLKRQKSLEK